jgi:hypothetical protein
MFIRSQSTMGSLTRSSVRWALVFAALCFAPAVHAASIVEVRIGAHREYTRVVLELDAPSRYKIEREAAADGTGQIVVKLDATSGTHIIRAKSELILGVSVDAAPDGGSLAKIRLKDGKLKLREMILTKPPRIVLDVMAPGSDSRGRAEAGSCASAQADSLGRAEADSCASAQADSHGRAEAGSCASAQADSRGRAEAGSCASTQADSRGRAEAGSCASAQADSRARARARAGRRAGSSGRARAEAPCRRQRRAWLAVG